MISMFRLMSKIEKFLEMMSVLLYLQIQLKSDLLRKKEEVLKQLRETIKIMQEKVSSVCRLWSYLDLFIQSLSKICLQFNSNSVDIFINMLMIEKIFTCFCFPFCLLQFFFHENIVTVVVSSFSMIRQPYSHLF